MTEKEKNEKVIADFKKAAEAAMKKVRALFLGKDKAQMKNMLNEFDTPSLKFLHGSALAHEEYEICGAVKEVIEEREKV